MTLSRKLLLLHQIPRLGPLEKQLRQLGPNVAICCYRPEVYEMLIRSGFSVLPLDSGCSLEGLKHIRELSLGVLQRLNEGIKPILRQEFGDAVNGDFLSSVHYNHFVNVALTSFLIPYYQLCGLLAQHEYTEVIEVRAEGETREFGDFFNGKMGEKPAVSTWLACQRNKVEYTYSELNLYQSRTPKSVVRLWRKVRGGLSQIKRKLQKGLPDLQGNSRSIIPLSVYDFPWVSSTMQKELGFETMGLPRRRFSIGYKPDPSRIESLCLNLKQALLRWIKDDAELADEEKRLIEYVLSIFFEFFVRQLDLFHFLIRDEQESYNDVRVMSIPVVALNDIVYVRYLTYKHARLISWQHGGNYGYLELPVFLHHELVNCEVFLAYGTSPRDYVENSGSAINGNYGPLAKVEVLGTYRIPAQVVRRDSGASPDRATLEILYACRDYQAVICNLANAWVMTSLLYFDLQKEILSALAGLNWANITVQPHIADVVSAMALRNWVDGRGYQNIGFGTPGNFSSALATADIVVCDFPSTSFLEALWSGLPAIVYQKPGSYEVVGRYFAELGDAVQLVTTPEDLVGALGKIRGGEVTKKIQPVSLQAFLIGREPGFNGEADLWRSILD